MREQPNAEALLAIARDVLKHDILPLLPSDQRYNLLMVANAMAIASRQCQQGYEPEQEELKRWQQGLGSDALLQSCAVEMSQNIRAGVYDSPDGRVQLAKMLVPSVHQRVLESNPKAL